MIHHYDSKTGRYLDSSLADSDPQQPDCWLIPSFATDKPLPERLPQTWPFWQNETWTMLPDYRGQVLYRTDNGDQAEITVPGVAPEECGLTTKARPGGEYVWRGGDWIIDPAIVEKQRYDNAMAEFNVKMAKARAANLGKADTLASGMLEVFDAELFKAWAIYQMDLVRVTSDPEFPAGCKWPPEPDAEAIARRIEAERKLLLKSEQPVNIGQ